MKRWLTPAVVLLVLWTCGCPTIPPQVHFVSMHWDHASVNDTYVVYRSVPPDTPAIPLATTSTKTYVDKQVVAGATYTYRVTARDASGVESGPSNEVSFTVPK